MKTILTLWSTMIICISMNAQIIIIPSSPKFLSETSLNGQVAVQGYSGPIGPIVPPPTDPGSIGVRGIGFTGVVGEARADAGYGVHGKTNKYAGKGVYGEATGVAGDGVYGTASGQGGWAIYGHASGSADWGGYFSGGKGLLARPRLGVENFNPQYPIHVGTASSNGNGAHVTNGGTWTNGSSRSFKTDFRKINVQNILQKLSQIDIAQWRYKNSEEGDHVGPTAEDFYQAFALGDDNKYISTTDADGVALAAIQALYQRVLRLEKVNDEQSKIILEMKQINRKTRK